LRAVPEEPPECDQKQEEEQEELFAMSF